LFDVSSNELSWATLVPEGVAVTEFWVKKRRWEEMCRCRCGAGAEYEAEAYCLGHALVEPDFHPLLLSPDPDFLPTGLVCSLNMLAP